MIDKVVREELIAAYALAKVPDTFEDGEEIPVDEELLKALQKVIEFYSSKSQYKEFLNQYPHLLDGTLATN